MANDLRGRPWVIDTASATQIAGSPNRVFCLGFTYRDYNAAGNLAIVKDLARNVTVCTLVGKADKTPAIETWQFPGQQIRNMAITQIDGGGFVDVMVK